MSGPLARPPEERFWDLVNGPWCDSRVGPDDCWIWMGCTGISVTKRHRYGRFRLGSAMEGAHRAALILTGSLPPSSRHDAAHWWCDNSLCVNFTHLRWETHQSNIRDCISKGRLLATSQGFQAPA